MASGEKSNLDGLEHPTNLAQVLLFKEAIALGWDCPRAAVLLIFRKMQSDQFTIRTVGRILRMPQQKHYPDELLNVGYVFTDIAKDKIEIVTADAGYILSDTPIAHRRPDLRNVALKSVYSERPNIERNYLGPDFRKVLYDTATEFWRLEQGAGLFSIAELAAMRGDDDDYLPLPETDDLTVNENRRRVSNSLRLDVKHHQHRNTQGRALPRTRCRPSRWSALNLPAPRGEINGVFIAYIDGKGNQFERQGRTDKIASFLTELIGDFFGIYETDAKKVVLYHENRPKFDRLLDMALERYARQRRQAAANAAANRVYKQHEWEIPAERVYDADTNQLMPAGNHALQPFVQLNTASNPERESLSTTSKPIQSISTGGIRTATTASRTTPSNTTKARGGEKALFYVDFVIRTKTAHISLRHKSAAGSDLFAADKHNALLEYIAKNSSAEQPSRRRHNHSTAAPTRSTRPHHRQHHRQYSTGTASTLTKLQTMSPKGIDQKIRFLRHTARRPR